jgi:type I restriction enzyme M protein
MISVYEKIISDVTSKFKGEVSSIDETKILLASLSLKYAEQEFKGKVSNEAKLSYLIKDAANVIDNIQVAFKLIEQQIPEMQDVYRKLKVSWELLDNKTIVEVLLSIYKEKIEDFPGLVREIREWIMKKEGRRGGEHSTPNFINRLMVTLLDIKDKSSFCDWAAGYGGSLTEVKHQHPKKSVDLYGQEINGATWAVAKLCLLMTGCIDAQFKLGNTLTEPLFLADDKLKKFDFIAMNIPFSLHLDEHTQEILRKDHYKRFLMGDLPRSSADMAFIQHALSALKDKGRAVICVSNGTLSRGGMEEAIRQNLIYTDQIEAVISLPHSLLSNTSIPINLLVLNKNKPDYKQNKIQFIQASELFEEEGRKRYLTEEHIRKIHQSLNSNEEEKDFSKYVSISDLEDNLTVTRYIQSNKFEIENEGTFSIHLDRLNSDKEPLQEIRSLGKIYRGLNVTSKTAEEVDSGDFKLIKLSDVQDGSILMEGLSIIEMKTNFKASLYQVEEGDVIISSRGSNVKVAVVPAHEGNVLLSQNFIGFRAVKNKLHPHFLQAYLESPIGKYQLSRLMTGTAVLVLNPKNFGTLQVSLPSMDVQENIALRYKVANDQYNKALKEAEIQLKSEKMKLYDDMGILQSFELLHEK